MCAAAGFALFADQRGRQVGEGGRKKERLLKRAMLERLFFFVSPSGTDGPAANTWIVAQESAMCPTDGPSENEGTSCTDGPFRLRRVSRQMAKYRICAINH